MMLSTVCIPASRRSAISGANSVKSFQGSDVRVVRMPWATTMSAIRRQTEWGILLRAPRMPPCIRSGVFLHSAVPCFSHCMGSSPRCWAIFLTCTPGTKNSMASKPASSRSGSAASIMPVVMFKAQRLWLPSRTVVSTNLTSVLIFPPCAEVDRVPRGSVPTARGLLHAPARGDRPDGDDPPAARDVVDVVQVDCRIAVAGQHLHGVADRQGIAVRERQLAVLV